jgi:hypothetical protein
VHADSSGYGWGAVLNEHIEARGFWSKEDEHQHITWKELKAVRYFVESFLPQLAGCNVLLHEDNHVVYHIETCITSRSPIVIDELRRLWLLLDTKSTNIKARYMR